MAIKYEIVEADPLDLFLGVCKPCRRPKRETDTGYPLSGWADKHSASCVQCGGPVEMQRVYGVEIGMQCDDRCSSATGQHCECACGGVNHGGIWSEHDEILANALRQFRETQEKREMKKQERKKNREADKAEAFRAWCSQEPQKDTVDYLREYAVRMRNGTEAYPNRFLTSLAEWLSEHKPLTSRQLEGAQRTIQMRRRMENRQRVEASNPHVDHLTTDQILTGIFRFQGETVVVKPNVAMTRSYANRVVPAHDRLNKAGERVKYELEYAPGLLARLTEDDRMPEEDVKKFLIEYGRCVRCGHGLKKGRSVAAMMGKTCATKMGIKY